MESYSGEQVEEADTTSGIGFDVEPYITLSHSTMVEKIHYSKIVKTNKWLEEHKVKIIPIGYLGDMEFVKNDSFTCLIGIPIQLPPA